MNIGKAIGYGILAWVVIFVVASILMALGGTSGSGWMAWLMVVVVAIVAWVVAGMLGVKSAGEGFGYGVVLAVVALLLDWLITSRFDSTVMGQWSVWVGYVLLLLLPMFRVSGGSAPMADKAKTE